MSALALRQAPRRAPRPAFQPLYCSAERIVLIRGTHYNVCLREIHDAIYGAPDPDGIVQFVLVRGARFLSRRADLPACSTGYWPRGTR